MKLSTILIAGCGDVGIRLARRLNEDAYTVYGLRRNTDKLPEFIRPVAGDLSHREKIPVLPKQIDGIVYCATADGRSEEAYQQAYVKGLQNVLAQVQHQKLDIKRVLFTSSTSVYGQSAGEWVNEQSETKPSGFSGRTMLEAETCLAASGFDYSSIRFAGIYGPGRQRFIDNVRLGKIQVCENYPQYTNRIHSEDCAGVLKHLLELKNVEPCYIGVDSSTASRLEVADWVAMQLELPLPDRVAPEEIKGGQNKRCRNKLLMKSGYGFEYPDYQAGYKTLFKSLN